MDAASLQADEQFAYTARTKDETLAKLNQAVERLRREAATLAAGNRLQRRKAKVAVRRIDAFETWMGARIQDFFDRLTKGYKPEFGVFEDVQREAADKLSAIFR